MRLRLPALAAVILAAVLHPCAAMAVEHGKVRAALCKHSLKCHGERAFFRNERYEDRFGQFRIVADVIEQRGNHRFRHIAIDQRHAQSAALRE